MNLIHAQRCSNRLLEWLMPFCERIQVAGSVRRERPQVNDIDLVAVPKIRCHADLLGHPGPSENLLAVEIRRRSAEEHWTVLSDGKDQLSLMARGIQVDVFYAGRSTWGTRLLCRTGSKEHNIWLAQVAQDAGGKWHPYHGLYLHGSVLSDTEEAIYAALGLDFVAPRDRESSILRRLGPRLVSEAH